MENNVASFFDNIAENWDERNIIDSQILDKIADISGVVAGKTVLDAGCGTGVMLPVYLDRNVKSITAVDISEKMLSKAKKKFSYGIITYECCDIINFISDIGFDCVVVHNAFPHFLKPKAALDRLGELTLPGGRLTIAHSISRASVLGCHRNVPEISVELPEAEKLADMFPEQFSDFIIISDERCYIVSGIKGERRK